MADLLETTLSLPIDDRNQFVTIPALAWASVNVGDGVYFIFGELAVVQSKPSSGLLYVTRGRGGNATPHGGLEPLIIGGLNRFHTTDPVGLPPGLPADNPWVNFRDARVFRAQGDQGGPGATTIAHTWIRQNVLPAIGSLGVRTLSIVPNSTP